DQAEGDDREGDDDDEELRATARMGGRVPADVVDDEGVAGLEGVDRHVLGAVVLEDAPDIAGLGDEQQVAEEDRDPDQALDEMLDEPVLDVRGRGARDQERQQEEDPDTGDQGQAKHERDRSLPELDALLAFLAGAGRLERGAPDEPAYADEQGLVQDDEAAQE